jgi:hypothetical protein
VTLRRPESPIFLSPILHHRLVGPITDTPAGPLSPVLLLPIPSGHRTPSLPIAKYITLSRIASPWSVDKRYEERFTTGLRRHFEQEGKERMRLIKQGDVIAIPVPREEVNQYEDEGPRLEPRLVRRGREIHLNTRGMKMIVFALYSIVISLSSTLQCLICLTTHFSPWKKTLSCRHRPKRERVNSVVG